MCWSTLEDEPVSTGTTPAILLASLALLISIVTVVLVVVVQAPSGRSPPAPVTLPRGATTGDPQEVAELRRQPGRLEAQLGRTWEMIRNQGPHRRPAREDPRQVSRACP
jgi:hypothetical protein